jgi:hypothetical protein
MFTHKYDVRWYVDRRVDKRLDERMKTLHTTTLMRMAETDPGAQEILQQHRDQLDSQLSRRAKVLMNDVVVRANLVEAIERDNEARLQRLEARYTWGLRVTQFMSAVSCLTLLGIVGVGLANRADNRN